MHVSHLAPFDSAEVLKTAALECLWLQRSEFYSDGTFKFLLQNRIRTLMSSATH